MRLRRFAAILGIGLVLAGGPYSRTARADEAGVFESDRRTTLREELSATYHDLFRSKPRVYWARGPVLEASGKSLSFHLGYEGQFDAIGYQGMDAAVEAAAGERWLSGTYVRRSRIAIEGFILRYWYFRARYGWSGFDVPVFQDLFIEWSGLTRFGEAWPIFRVGQVKEAMTIDWMNNALRNTFAERAMFTTTIVPNRTVGVRGHGTALGERLTYQAGYYKAGAEQLSEGSGTDARAVTARLTGLPWAPADHPHRLLHLGLSASRRWDLEKVQYSAKPESWLGPAVVDTGEFDARRIQVAAAELFFQYDRLSVQVEGARTEVELHDATKSSYYGWYGQVGYFITPGNLTFNRRLGVVGRTRPRCSIFCPAKSGAGVWEVAARYSWLDLDSGPVPGGTVWNFTLGINWWARDNIRVLFNFIYTDVTGAYGVKGADGTMSTMLVRFVYDL